ncbi:MAG TPA: hypothetical protein VG435_06530 [Acidimicrobiales bacterium]|jgi:hypothetical protein|nr:hypothetical protein [Acidimicrobiales bacterium]
MAKTGHTPRKSLRATPDAVGARRTEARRGPGLIALQRSAGNRAVAQALSRKGAPGAVVVQRHSAGVLEGIAKDLKDRRTKVKGYTHPAETDLLAYIKTQVDEVAKLPEMVTICDTKEKLTEDLAKDLAARAGSSTVDEAHTTSAKSQVDNGGGGFTALDGTVYMLASANNSSALYHELIHVISGEGGATKLAATKTNLNEGFTNYFAEQLAEKYKSAIFPAYPTPTKWAKSFVSEFGAATAYNLYFKDDEAVLFTTLAGRLKTNVETPNKFTKTEVVQFYKAGNLKTDAELADLVKAKIKQGDFMAPDEPSLKWLQRFCGVTAE